MKHTNKLKTEKYDTFCPLFPGFYGTLFEYEGEGNDIEEYNREHDTDFDWDDFDWDYQDYRNRVAKAFVNRLENELNHILPIKMEFQEVYSPKEYNFINDAINVSVELNLSVLLAHIRAKKELAAQYFINKYTSCSGFISFHSPNIDTWLNKAYILQDSKHRVGALLDCLCSIQDAFECTDDQTIYWVDSEFYVDFAPKTETEGAFIPGK